MTNVEFKLTEQDYRYLFENASDAMWVHDLKGSIVDVNTAFANLTGFERQEILGKSVSEFISAQFLYPASAVQDRLLKGEVINQPYEQKLVRKDGAVRTVQMSTSLVIIANQAQGFQHIARDVTEERSVEEMLAKITDGSPIATFVINREHRVTHWNTALVALSGISKQEIINTDEQWRSFYTEKRPTMADLIVDGASADEIGAYYVGKYRKSRLIEGAFEAEDFFPALEQHGKWLRFTASPVRNRDGEIMGAIETLQDVTEEKRLQESMRFYIRQVTRAQEEERRRISRELHDDVSSSLVLLMRNLDALTANKQVKLPALVGQELERLRGQAEGTLEQLRRCAQDLRPRILDDMGLVAALEWMADDLEKGDGIKVSVEVSGDRRELADEEQLLLFRIAQEALNNIRWHASATVADIRLSFKNDNVRMSINDNGHGFAAPETLEDSASMERLGILGMYERAQLLGGQLKIESEPGRGTSVTVEFPPAAEPITRNTQV